MIRRTIREWGYLPVEEPGPGAFDRKVADQILEIARRSSVGGDHGENVLLDHRRKLRAQQVVGVLVSEDATLEILPKIDGTEEAETRTKLIHMLSAVFDLEIDDGEITQVGWQTQDVLEILIRVFTDRLVEAFRKGMPRQYISHFEDLPRLRGRMDVVRQFTIQAAKPQLISSRFDELSADIALNQIIKAAVTRLSALSRSVGNRRRLAELKLAYEDVAAIPVPLLPWKKVTIDRTNSAWRLLLEFAKLFLSGRFQNTTAGGSVGFCLLFEMNELFEEFVGRMLGRALIGSPYRVRLQGPQGHTLTERTTGRRVFATRPDATIMEGDRPITILDTKWKKIEGHEEDLRGEVAQADIYQMLAYARVYGCEDLVLLYPHHGEMNRKPGWIRSYGVNGATDCRLAIATVPLGTPSEVMKALKATIFDQFAPIRVRASMAQELPKKDLGSVLF